jgi:hypothetical protein
MKFILFIYFCYSKMEDLKQREISEKTPQQIVLRAPEQDIPVAGEEGFATPGVYFKPR